MKHLLCTILFIQATGLLAVSNKSESSMTLNHPDKTGYQSVLVGSDKHKFGYELKQNKQFHHTTTEKDGVRLGCYGYELDGKKFSTQYVADARGYRIVSNQDLITVYPKNGSRSRKASFVGDFNEDPSVSENIRYFFPTGCKGTDILIDNSSRLRSMIMSHILEDMPAAHPRLPVTRKTTKLPLGYVYHESPNAYIPPGPMHIYAPNQIQAPTKKPGNLYLPALQADVPSNVYLPSKPASPFESNVNLISPPADTYLPPHKPADEYLPPATTPAPTLNQEIVPPSSANCVGSSRCCDDSYGKIVIPIPLTIKDGGGCCKPQAKLILPVNGFDSKSLAELKLSIPEEIDVTKLLKNILENLL